MPFLEILEINYAHKTYFSPLIMWVKHTEEGFIFGMIVNYHIFYLFKISLHIKMGPKNWLCTKAKSPDFIIR